jgi:hypothetical protein
LIQHVATQEEETSVQTQPAPQDLKEWTEEEQRVEEQTQHNPGVVEMEVEAELSCLPAGQTEFEVTATVQPVEESLVGESTEAVLTRPEETNVSAPPALPTEMLYGELEEDEESETTQEMPGTDLELESVQFDLQFNFQQPLQPMDVQIHVTPRVEEERPRVENLPLEHIHTGEAASRSPSSGPIEISQADVTMTEPGEIPSDEPPLDDPSNVEQHAHLLALLHQLQPVQEIHPERSTPIYPPYVSQFPPELQ